MARPRIHNGSGGKRAGAGRPQTVGIAKLIQIGVTGSQLKHLEEQSEGISAYLRKLIDQDIQGFHEDLISNVRSLTPVKSLHGIIKPSQNSQAAAHEISDFDDLERVPDDDFAL